MGKLIASKTVKARKLYRDDSAEFIDNALDFIRSGGELSFTELRAIAKLKASNWNILPGQLYTRQYCEMDGSTYTFKSLPEILKICLKYDLYDS